ncbi:14-3-3 protein [Rickenella mellea]|uniref:14-3-3 protein n=1 Tax=Rickenella mellea TaxID=50990 RepID=A0A4Y7PE20_9AGAM|nr:14-3-3 protein [Rickenella mellea]
MEISELPDPPRTVEERNLLYAAHKNVISMLRVLKEGSEGNEAQVSMTTGYPEKVKSELANICDEVSKSTTGSSSPRLLQAIRRFYHKMSVSYVALVRADKSLKAYKAASDVTVTELPPTHSIRLGLALNFSVFYYEILDSLDRACRLAKQAFQQRHHRARQPTEE